MRHLGEATPLSTTVTITMFTERHLAQLNNTGKRQHTWKTTFCQERGCTYYVDSRSRQLNRLCRDFPNEICERENMFCLFLFSHAGCDLTFPYFLCHLSFIIESRIMYDRPILQLNTSWLLCPWALLRTLSRNYERFHKYSYILLLHNSTSLVCVFTLFVST